MIPPLHCCTFILFYSFYCTFAIWYWYYIVKLKASYGSLMYCTSIKDEMLFLGLVNIWVINLFEFKKHRVYFRTFWEKLKKSFWRYELLKLHIDQNVQFFLWYFPFRGHRKSIKKFPFSLPPVFLCTVKCGQPIAACMRKASYSAEHYEQHG